MKAGFGARAAVLATVLVGVVGVVGGGGASAACGGGPPHGAASVAVVPLDTAPPPAPPDASAGLPAGDSPPPDAPPSEGEAEAASAPVPVAPEGLLALCAGPAEDVGEGRPFRGVTPKDNGGGTCCPLEGDAFVCVLDHGMQHTPVLVTETVVVAGPKGPRSAFTSKLSDNQGMAVGAEPFATLAVRDRKGERFELVVEPEGACAREGRAKDAAAVCARRGTYTLTKGVLRRVR